VRISPVFKDGFEILLSLFQSYISVNPSVLVYLEKFARWSSFTLVVIYSPELCQFCHPDNLIINLEIIHPFEGTYGLFVEMIIVFFRGKFSLGINVLN
jgi:hypothetical protein